MKVDVTFEPVGLDELNDALSHAEEAVQALQKAVGEFYTALGNIGIKASQPTDSAAD